MKITVSTIVNRESLRSFFTTYRPMKRGTFLNKESGEQFSKLIFPDFSVYKGDDGIQHVVRTNAIPEAKKKDSSYLQVGFSSNLGEITNAELKAQLDQLQVVTLESGSFKLCKQGEGTWEDVDLGN